MLSNTTVLFGLSTAQRSVARSTLAGKLSFSTLLFTMSSLRALPTVASYAPVLIVPPTVLID